MLFRSAEIDGQSSGGKTPKILTASELFSHRYAATIPQIAPDAPREAETKLFRITQDVSENRLPIAPDEMYMARKLARPTSSWRRVPTNHSTVMFTPKWEKVW